MNKQTKILGAISITILCIGLTLAMLRVVNKWFDTHEFKFNRAITVELKSPIEIVDRKVAVAEVIRIIEEVPHPDDLETDTEKYIYNVFGIEDYKIALAIAGSESGLREEAFNVNTNGSIDVGVFQINSVHFDKVGCSLKEVSTMNGNVDCAKQIYDSSGWNPWVVFNTGAFKNKL